MPTGWNSLPGQEQYSNRGAARRLCLLLLLLLGGMLGTASAIVMNNVEVWSVGDLNIYLTNHQGE